MKRPRRRAQSPRKKPGTSPGTLVVAPDALPSVAHVMAYGPDALVEEPQPTLERVNELGRTQPVTWLNVDGLGNATMLEEVGTLFDLHRLALEDVLNVEHRPKVEPYESYYFAVLRMPVPGDALDTEQVSLFVGENFVVTFQEKPGDCLEPVRQRIRAGRPRLRNGGSDYLAYALIDAVVDAYFPVLETYGDRLEELEREILAQPTHEAVVRLRNVKRDLVTLRRAVWPLREALSALTREESTLIRPATQIYLRDCYDHVVQLIDLIETQREFSSGLMDLYMSSISNRMNEVMKVLTMIATLFIPLSFVAGLYGMNFDTASPWNMPELGWRLGYPYALALMLVISVGFAVYFKRKGWF